MGKDTNIEWCDSTVNGQMGCDGCELYVQERPEEATCYAYHLVTKRAGLKGYPQAFNLPEIFPGRIEAACRWKDLTGTDRPDKPWLSGLPRVIFLDDLGDTFTRSLPLDWLMDYVEMMEAAPVIWLFLTKEAKRMREFFRLLGRVPANFWPGVTVTSPKTMWRLRELMRIESDRLWLSLEPYWDHVSLRPYLTGEMGGRLSWVILGGESEQIEGRPPAPMWRRWAREVKDDCKEIGGDETSVFLKQWGYHVPVTAYAADGLWQYEREPGEYEVVEYGRDELLCRDFGGAGGAGIEWMAPVGKKKAGAVLDGRHWREVPTPSPRTMEGATL